jgi:DHA3 family macrolide efflux protein-like MFS transporter
VQQPAAKNENSYIYLALLISGTGDGIAKIALLSFVYDLTTSSTAVGMVITCLTLPGIFSGLMAGVLADRYSKLKILIIGHLLLGITTAGFVLACHYKSTVLIYLLAFMTGTLMAFADGPFRAYFPDIFPQDRLSEVNSAVSSVYSLTMFIGPALGGIILEVGTVKLAFIIDAASFFIAAVLIGFLPATLPKMAEGLVNVRAVYRDIKLGIGYLLRSPLHRFLVFFFVCLFGIYCLSSGLITPFSKEILSVSNDIKGTRALSIILASFGLGGFISAFYIPGLMKKFSYLHTLMIGASLCVVELFALGHISNIYFLAAIIILTGSAVPMMLIPLFTFMQEKTKSRFMGRAMGALDTIVLFVSSLSFGLGGVLADAAGITRVFIITGFAILVLILTTLFLPVYKKVRQMESLE